MRRRRVRTTFRALRSLVLDRLTPMGRRVLLATLAAAVLGIDTRRSHTFVLFAVGAALLVVAAVAAHLSKPRARIEIALPDRATAGEPSTVRARIVPQRGASGEAIVAFPSRGAGLVVEPREVVVALDSGPVDLVFELVARTRGRYEIAEPTLRSLDPLGLVAGPARSRDHALLVHPPLVALDRIDQPAGRRHQPGGIPLSSSTADAVEFVGTRDFRPGDLVRNIHFRSWARRGAPVVREFQEEYFSRVAVVVDGCVDGAEAGRGRDAVSAMAFEAALSVAASVVDAFARTENVVDVIALGPEVHRVHAGRSLGQLEDVLDLLACLERARADFDASSEEILDELARSTTIVLVLLAWDPKREAFVRKARALGADVRAFVVQADRGAQPSPADPPRDVVPLRAEDVARAAREAT